MPPAIRTLLVDDEPLARAGIRDLLRQDPEIDVVGECGDGASAIAAIRALRPDLVLLDVQMPEIDGFGVIEAIGAGAMPPVIFITAWDRFAVRAFEVHALDYLLKPFEDDRFRSALQRAKQAVRGGDLEGMSRQLLALLTERGQLRPAVDDTYLTRIVVRKPQHTVFVSTEDIDWIEAADYCVRIHAKGKVYVIRESMARLEERLDPRRFFRAHRSGIVNLDRIREIQPGFHGDHVLILTDNSRVRLSRSRRSALEERLGQPL